MILNKLGFASLIVFLTVGLPAFESDAAQLPDRPIQQGVVGIAQSAASLVGSPLVDDLSTLVIKTTKIKKETVSVLPQDEVWLLNARNIDSDCSDLSKICVQRLEDGNWVDDELANLVWAHANDKSKATMIYSHGNRTNEDWAIFRGIGLYHDVLCDDPSHRPPARFVIWAWRSDKIGCRAIKDFVEKSRRSVVLGKVLADVLNQFPDRNIVLVGYSLGAQSVLTALNQETCNQSKFCDTTGGAWGQYRVALIAPALNGDYAAQQRCRYPDQSAVARGMIFVNQIDRALRASKVIRRFQAKDGDVPIATLASRGHLPLGQVEVHEVSAQVGRRHSQVKYSNSPTIKHSLCQLLSEVFATTQPLAIAQPIATQ